MKEDISRKIGVFEKTWEQAKAEGWRMSKLVEGRYIVSAPRNLHQRLNNYAFTCLEIKWMGSTLLIPDWYFSTFS